ncbi:MAG: tetratricopeptide repeat protein [Phycisphaerae bacterium]|nr:tetratricopeptide repeat protein [Phycisphaerae bacterium]
MDSSSLRKARSVADIAVARTILTCPNCLTENDKSTLIGPVLAEARRQRSRGKALLVARCIGCQFPLPIEVHKDGRVEHLDLDSDVQAEEYQAPLDEVPEVDIPMNEKQANTAYRKGLRYFKDNNYPCAYAHWKAAHRWFSRKQTAKQMTSALMSNMGMALGNMHDYARALICFENALLDMDQDRDPDAYATIVNNIGGTHLKLGNMREAEEYHKRAYELHLSQGADKSAL